MVIVSDTTALSSLFLINRLSWLPALFEAVLIPEAVAAELRELIRHGHDLEWLFHEQWLSVAEVKNRKLVEELSSRLDVGESEAIVLSLEKKPSYLLIDERKGHEVANELGIPTIGLLRIVIELKSRGLIGSVKPILNQLRSEGGFWISEKLYQRVLREVGE